MIQSGEVRKTASYINNFYRYLYKHKQTHYRLFTYIVIPHINPSSPERDQHQNSPSDINNL